MDCPRCGRAAEHIPEYDRWYCWSCKDYVPKDTGTGSKTPCCDICDRPGEPVPDDHAWYCWDCGRHFFPKGSTGPPDPKKGSRAEKKKIFTFRIKVSFMLGLVIGLFIYAALIYWVIYDGPAQGLCVVPGVISVTTLLLFFYWLLKVSKHRCPECRVWDDYRVLKKEVKSNYETNYFMPTKGLILPIGVQKRNVKHAVGLMKCKCRACGTRYNVKFHDKKDRGKMWLP